MSEAPSWRSLFQRLIELWRLRKVKYKYCQTCSTVLIKEELQGVLCTECYELDQFNQHKLQQQLANQARLVQGSLSEILAPGLQQMINISERKVDLEALAQQRALTSAEFQELVQLQQRQSLQLDRQNQQQQQHNNMASLGLLGGMFGRRH